MIAFLFISGISTKKNVAINASKDFTGSHLWGSSSIPFGGTLPSRGAHGNFTVTFRLFVVVVVKEVQSNGLLLLTIRHKYSPRWIHAIFLQKRQRLCRSQRASGSFSGDNSIKWAQIWAFFDTQFLKKEFIKGKNTAFKTRFSCFFVAVSDYATWRSGRSQMNTSANMPSTNKSTPGLLPRPPLQTIHGRTDWSAKYGHR